MPTSTTNYALQKPLVNNAVDLDLWGYELNTDLDDIDTLLKSGITTAVQSSQTTGFTASASISVKNLYPCDATGGAFAATLPAAATAATRVTLRLMAVQLQPPTPTPPPPQQQQQLTKVTTAP